MLKKLATKQAPAVNPLINLSWAVSCFLVMGCCFNLIPVSDCCFHLTLNFNWVVLLALNLFRREL